MKQQITGIYKITSPNNKIYIGQSINIERRFKEYKRLNKRSIGPKLYNSLKKYGSDNHTFEIIEECSLEQLNEYEFKWKILCRSVEEGLNCYYKDENTRKGIKDSNETRLKKSIAFKGRIRSEESKLKTSRALKGRKQSKEACLNKSIAAKGKLLGYKQSEETKQKRKLKLKGQKRSEETKKKMSKPKSIITKNKISFTTIKNQQKLLCPYCNIEGSGNIMNRWHFEKCKCFKK